MHGGRVEIVVLPGAGNTLVMTEEVYYAKKQVTYLGATF